MQLLNKVRGPIGSFVELSSGGASANVGVMGGDLADSAGNAFLRAKRS